MSTLDYELNLFRETLDWVKSKNLSTASDFIPHYDNYYKRASTHKPILSEDWGEFNTRHGANSVRGTTSELLAVTALSLPQLGETEVFQITNKREQGYGSDLKVKKGKSEFTVSCKTCKPRNIFTEGKLDTEVRLWQDYFEPARWRVDFISLAHPETKQVWLLNYPLVASIHCTVNEGGFFTPTFKEASVAFSMATFKKNFPTGLIYFDLTKDTNNG